MKNRIFIILCLLFFIAIFNGCKKEDEKETFNSDYSYYSNEELIPSDWDWLDINEYKKMLEKNVFVKKDFDTIKKALTSDKRVYIYFGYNPYKYQCPFCAAALPTANEAALANKVEEILYLDIFDMRKNNTDEYLWLLDFIQKQVSDFGEKLLVPDIFVVENGKVLGHHRATIEITKEDGQTEYLKGMTIEQKEQLKKIYIDLFKKE